MIFFKTKPIINAFDTEGYNGKTNLLADAYSHYTENTNDLLEFLYNNGKDLNFFYNLTYDFQAILKSLITDKKYQSLTDKELGIIKTGDFNIDGYHIKYIAGKGFSLKKINDKKSKKVIRFYDIAQFYKKDGVIQSLEAVLKALGQEGKNAEELGIDSEKIGMVLGYYEKRKTDIIPYCINDCVRTKKISELKVNATAKLLGELNNSKPIYPKKYYSSASNSKAVLEIKVKNQAYTYKGLLKNTDNPKKYHRLISNSYKGGFMYDNYLGLNKYKEYDINSAYPYAMSKLKDIIGATYKELKDYDKNADYSFYYAEIDNTNFKYPIAERIDKETLYYPAGIFNSYITGIDIEFFINHSINFKIIYGLGIYCNTNKRPFGFLKDLYSKRIDYKNLMKNANNNDKNKYDMLQYGLKIMYNAMYGTTAEHKNNMTKWTNFIYASYITSYTRNYIYNTIDKIGMNNVIAIRTDAIIVKDNVVIETSDNLGFFKLESQGYIINFMSGTYILFDNDMNVIAQKMRGFGNIKGFYDLIKDLDKSDKEFVIKRTKSFKQSIIQHDINSMNIINQAVNKNMDLKANLNRYIIDENELTFKYLCNNSVKTLPKRPEKAYTLNIPYKDIPYHYNNTKISIAENNTIDKLNGLLNNIKTDNPKNAKRTVKNLLNKLGLTVNGNDLWLIHTQQKELQNNDNMPLLSFDNLTIDEKIDKMEKTLNENKENDIYSNYTYLEYYADYYSFDITKIPHDNFNILYYILYSHYNINMLNNDNIDLNTIVNIDRLDNTNINRMLIGINKLLNVFNELIT